MKKGTSLQRTPSSVLQNKLKHSQSCLHLINTQCFHLAADSFGAKANLISNILL